MDIEIPVNGFWLAGEIASICERLFGVAIENSTSDGLVIIHPRPRELTKEELTMLKKELSIVKPSATERMLEVETQMAVRKVARQAHIERLRQKAKLGNMTIDDLPVLVLAILGE